MLQVFNVEFAYSNNSVGVLAAAIGTVKIERSGAVLSANTTDAIFLQDKVITLGKSRAQILLIDQTAINLSQNAEIIIDKFVFGTEEDTVALKVSKGTFRFISGKVATKSPERVNVETPVATIGVRGTEFIGQIDVNESLVALLNGKIEVANDGYSQLVGVPGFGVTINSVGVIAEPIKIPEEKLDSLINNVSTREEALGNEVGESEAIGDGDSSDGTDQDTDEEQLSGATDSFDDNGEADGVSSALREGSDDLNLTSGDADGDVFGVDLEMASNFR